MKPISIYVRPMGKLGPLLFFPKNILGILMTIESQDLSLTSHPKDGLVYWPLLDVMNPIVSVPVHHCLQDSKLNLLNLRVVSIH